MTEQKNPIEEETKDQILGGELVAGADAEAKKALAADLEARLINDIKTSDDEMIKEAEKRATEIAKQADQNADKVVNDANEKAAEIIKVAECDIAEREELAVEKAAGIVSDAENEAQKIIKAAADDTVLKEQAVKQAELDETEAAEAAREKEKKKAFKAKQAAIKKPQAITKGKLNDAILLAGELGNMPTDITNLMMHLRKDHGFVMDGNPPVHTVTGYGLTAQGPGGFKSALTNWAAAVRRIAAAEK